MNTGRREWTLWITATLAIALLIHMGTLYALPRLVMAKALAKLGTPNTMHYMSRPNARSRTVVRPSPDILYASCPYDLSKGPLWVTAKVPHWTYWSVSAFDSATNNFFVRDDRQIAGNSIELLLVRPHQPWPALDNALERIILFPPSERGLILFRAVIDDEKHLPALEALLHQSRCQTVAKGGRLR